MNREKIIEACAALGAYPYRSESCYPLPDAQRNLSGRTHYVDDDTLRFFKARVLMTRIMDDGLLFGLVESFRGPEGDRYFRPVIFDIFGEVMHRPDLEGSYKTRKAAERAFWEAANAIDADTHTADTVRLRIKRMRDEMDRATKAIGAA